jgi:hypothetical protein
MIDKDRSIVTQVAAKIAADLTPEGTDTDKIVSDFTYIFENVRDVLIENCLVEMPRPASAPSTPSQIITSTFPGATEVDWALEVVGKQHGELPNWLIDACKRDGVTRIYDNRDGLAQNPKRPWFKAVDDKEKAYWAPRSK